MEKQTEGVKIATKALVSAIPWIGGSATSVWNDIAQKKYEQRLNDFLDQLKSDLIQKIDLIDSQKVNTEDFQDIFANTIRAVQTTRHLEKRNALRNIIMNSITRKDMDFDETELFIRYIQELPIKHMIILEKLNTIVIKQKDDNFAKDYSMIY